MAFAFVFDSRSRVFEVRHQEFASARNVIEIQPGVHCSGNVEMGQCCIFGPQRHSREELPPVDHAQLRYSLLDDACTYLQ